MAEESHEGRVMVTTSSSVPPSCELKVSSTLLLWWASSHDWRLFCGVAMHQVAKIPTCFLFLGLIGIVLVTSI